MNNLFLIVLGLITLLFLDSCGKRRIAYDVDIVLSNNQTLSNEELGDLILSVLAPPEQLTDSAFYFPYIASLITSDGDTVSKMRLPEKKEHTDVAMVDKSIVVEVKENTRKFISLIRKEPLPVSASELPIEPLMTGHQLMDNILLLYNPNAEPGDTYTSNNDKHSIFSDPTELQREVWTSLHPDLPIYSDGHTSRYKIIILVTSSTTGASDYVVENVTNQQAYQIGDTMANGIGIVKQVRREYNGSGQANDVFDIAPVPNTYYLSVGYYKGGNGRTAIKNAAAHAKKEIRAENADARVLIKDDSNCHVIIAASKDENQITQELEFYKEFYKNTKGGIEVLFADSENILGPSASN